MCEFAVIGQQTKTCLANICGIQLDVQVSYDLDPRRCQQRC